MKITILLFTIVGLSTALPSQLDWSRIQPNHGYVKPLENASVLVLPRVVGGRESVPNSRPYQAALIIDGAQFCGGSLISSRFVLTAAHCIEGKAYIQIILGAHNIREVEDTQIVVTSTNIIVHPNYNPENFNNDIGLVRFPNSIVFNSYIEPIALPSDGAGLFEGFEGILTGWGRLTDASNGLASTLHEVDLIVMDNLMCSQSYGLSIVTDSTICTLGTGNVGGCDGDSGGPLVVEGVQVGIASFVAYSGCQRGFPTGYARITALKSWIVANSDVE